MGDGGGVGGTGWSWRILQVAQSQYVPSILVGGCTGAVSIGKEDEANRIWERHDTSAYDTLRECFGRAANIQHDSRGT